MKKVRLDKALVGRGLVDDLERARALILAGKVLVRGQVNSKAGAQVAADVELAIKEAEHPYVSRGALKLEKALNEFSIDPTGRTAIDVGASTGGFTDILLKRGASKVYAVDVGYGQLDWSLRQDPRVVVIERQNIRHLEKSRIETQCDLAVIDVSFISLAKVLPKVLEILGPGEKPIICLIKPQFEATRDEVGDGVIRDEAIRLACIERVHEAARQLSLHVGPLAQSPITGPKGNVEFVQLLTTPPLP